MTKWKTTKSKSVYKNKFLEIFEDEVVDPNGNSGKKSLIDIGEGSVVVIAENNDGELYLVGQERYAISEYSWEFVSGGIKNNENPLDAAKRELAEETGMSGGDWKKLLAFHPMNSLARRKVFVYLARNLKNVIAEADSYEKIDIRSSDPEDIIREIQEGKIKDAFTICAMFSYLKK